MKNFLASKFCSAKEGVSIITLPRKIYKKRRVDDKILYLRNKAGTLRQGNGPNRYNNYEEKG